MTKEERIKKITRLRGLRFTYKEIADKISKIEGKNFSKQSVFQYYKKYKHVKVIHNYNKNVVDKDKLLDIINSRYKRIDL